MTEAASTNLIDSEGQATGPRLRRYQLEVVGGPDGGTVMEIDEGTFLIGTHANNDLKLTDKTISRYHLELQLRPEGLRVTDLDSTNGTYQGATRIGSIVVQGKVRLRLGGTTELSLSPLDGQVEAQPFTGERFGRAIGASKAMGSLFGLLGRVAQTDSTVLIEGETGTGKELLAEGLHLRSQRKPGPYVVVDCGAIAKDLIGSELFGHVRGAFTGAFGDKRGLLQEADGGTLFLDEIGELAMELQPHLLRVLERREVRRIGDSKARRVNIRVVAATNRDLQQQVAEGKFREDLYFRLAVVKVTVPPLRQRKEDIPLLIRHIVADLGRDDFHPSGDVLARMMAYAWPGNVRELRNIVERGLFLSNGDFPLPKLEDSVIGMATRPGLPVASSSDVYELPFKTAKGKLVESFEREYLSHLLMRHHGNVSRAASEAGIDRNYIHRLVKKYNLPVDRR
jgi:DNA-binding NtrC family response regulator